MKKRIAVIFAAVMASVLTMGFLGGCDEEADQGKYIPYKGYYNKGIAVL